MSTAPEIQKLIDDAVNAATEALAENNRKLTVELKNTRAKVREGVIDPTEHAALQARVEELQTSNEKLTKSSKSETDKLSKNLETERGFTRKLIVDNALTDAATKHGVAPEYIPAVRALIAPRVQVVEDGEARVAKIGDKALADHLSEWVQTDEGKHFVKAPLNGGGGARGNQGGGNAANQINRAAFEQLPPVERMAFVKGGGTLKVED